MRVFQTLVGGTWVNCHDEGYIDTAALQLPGPEDDPLTTPLLFALYLKPLRHDPRLQAAHLRRHTVRSHGA